jgi:hypothetical protein
LETLNLFDLIHLITPNANIFNIYLIVVIGKKTPISYQSNFSYKKQRLPFKSQLTSVGRFRAYFRRVICCATKPLDQPKPMAAAAHMRWNRSTQETKVNGS